MSYRTREQRHKTWQTNWEHGMRTPTLCYLNRFDRGWGCSLRKGGRGRDKGKKGKGEGKKRRGKASGEGEGTGG